MKNLFSIVRFFCLAAAVVSLAHADFVVFDRGLPNSTNVNGTNPATRSNEAWVTGFVSNGGASYQLVGDDFSLAVTGNVTSITVFEVANNNIGDGSSSAPTSEFSSISLYEGAAGSPLSKVSSTYSFAPVTYQPAGSNFVDVNGNAFQIYSLTFSNLNLPVIAGNTYQFALDATSAAAGACANSPFGDPCLLALHASNAALAGTRQDGADGKFINFTLSGGLATFESFCNAACQASTASVPAMAATDIDVRITATPEPATWATMVTMAGLALLICKRRAANR